MILTGSVSALLACLIPGIAATVISTWKTATNGTWNVDANWSNSPVEGGFPNDTNEGVATYDAVINATGSAYTVTLNTTDTIEHLTLGSSNATLTIASSGALTANTGMDLTAGSLLLNGGSISNSTINAAAGTLSFGANSSNLLSGVTVNGDLNLNTNQAVTKIGGGTTFTQAHLAASGASLGFTPGQTLSGTVLFEGAGGIRYVEMASAGALTIGTSGVMETNTGFTGDATIGGINYFGGAMTLSNQGLISSQVSGRTITISAASFANAATGKVQATNGGILTINAGGNWTNAGTINVNAATVNLNGTFDVTGGIGTWSNTGGTVNVTGTILNTGHTLTLDNTTGSWTVEGGTVSGGSLGFANGQTLLFAANGSNLLNGVTVNGDITLNTSQAVTKIAGGTTFTQAHLAASGASLGFTPGQTLSGTVLLEGAVGGTRYVEMTSAGALTIGTSGVVETSTGLTGDATIGGSNYFGGAMALTNQGLISSQVSGRTITISAATSFTNGATGTVQATNGGILTIFPGGNWTNSGTINVNAATVNLNGTFDVTGGIGTWSNTGGTVNVTGTILNTGHTLTLDNTTGSWTVKGGTVSGGSLDFANSQTLLFAANSSNLLAGLTVNGDLTLNTNQAVTKIAGGTTFTQAHLAASGASLGFTPGQTLNGTVLFEGAGGTRYVEMTSAGALTIGTSGIMETNTGFTGDATIGGSNYFGGAMALTNQGLISSQVSGRTITISAATSFTNGATGTVQATNGGILTIFPGVNWTNAGTINVNAATVNLNGTFDVTGGIGTWSNTGGTVNVTGTILNTGHTLTLDNTTGSWTVNGGTVSGGSLDFANGQTLLFAANSSNLLAGLTVNGDLTLNTNQAVTKIGGGTTFTQAHLAATGASLGFTPGQTLSGTLLFEGAGGTRYVEMASAGGLTIGTSGVMETNTGLTGDATIGGSNYFGGAMALTNQGLISSQVSGRTITISAATSFTNGATGTAQATGGGILTINPGGNWTNAGTIKVNAGTVNLGGTFDATGGIGTWSNTNGTVDVTGTILNTSHTLTLDSTTGSWTLSAGTVSGGALGFANGQTLLFTTNSNNLLTGVTVNGDITLNTNQAVTKIGGGTTFTQAHLAASGASLGFLPGQTLSGTVLFEGSANSLRYVEMTGAGAFTVGATGVIETNTGLGGDASIGGVNYYGGAMTLSNQGLISSQVNGRTITISAASFTNSGTLEAANGGLIAVTNGYTQTAGTTEVSGNSKITVSALHTIDIIGGSLEGNGTIASTVTDAGTTAPGNSGPGTLSITNDLTLAPTSAIQLEIGGLVQGTQYDLLSEAGTTPLTLQGTLSMTLINSFIPSFTDTYTVLTSNQALAGAFANVANGARMSTADGSTFQVNYGTGSSYGADNVVLSNFLAPEPTSAALLVGGAVGLLGSRRRTVRATSSMHPRYESAPARKS